MKLADANSARMPGPGDSAPPEPDDGWIDQLRADEMAYAEAMANPVWIAEWLNEECGDAPGHALRKREALDVPELLALLFTADISQREMVLSVVRRLRREYEKAHEGHIAERANELLRQQEREAERDREDAAAEQAYWAGRE